MGENDGSCQSVNIYQQKVFFFPNETLKSDERFLTLKEESNFCLILLLPLSPRALIDTISKRFIVGTVKGPSITSFIKLFFLCSWQKLIEHQATWAKSFHIMWLQIEFSHPKSRAKIYFKRANHFKFYSLNHLQPPVMMMWKNNNVWEIFTIIFHHRLLSHLALEQIHT